MGFVMVVRAIYFSLLGFSAFEVGLLLSFATAISAIHHITFGYLCDRYGRKPFLILGAIFSTLRMVIFAISTDFWMLALGQGLGAMGEGAGAGQPVVTGFITDKSEAKNRPGIYSTMAVTNSISTTIGSALGGLPLFLQHSYGYNVIEAHQLIWWACAFWSILSIFMVLPLKEEKRAPRPNQVKIEGPKVKSLGTILKFSVVRASSGLGMGLSESLLTLYFFERFLVGSEVLGPIFAFARFISIFSYMFIPPIVSRLGDVNTIIFSRFLSAGITVVFAFSSWYPLAISLMVLNRIVALFTMPIRQTFASGMVDPEQTATAIGISNFARMGVRSVAPTIAGYMFETISYSMPFLSGAFFIALNGVLYRTYFVSKDKV